MSSPDTASRDGPRSERRTDDGRPDGQESAGDPSGRGAAGGVSEWFARSALRTGLAFVGLLVLLFALGQAVGFPLLDLFVEAVTSPTGRWLVVALFALLLIVVAVRGFAN